MNLVKYILAWMLASIVGLLAIGGLVEIISYWAGK